MTLFPIKRVYEPPQPDDGLRVLVDRLWPRGVAKDKVDLWLKDVAPSDVLRKHVHGQPEQWDTFVAAYAAELGSGAALAAANLLLERRRAGPLTLLYAARDEHRNNAVALQRWLDDRLPDLD